MERKRLQIVHAPHKSPQAKLVKLADKLYNLRDLHRVVPKWVLKFKYPGWFKKKHNLTFIQVLVRRKSTRIFYLGILCGTWFERFKQSLRIQTRWNPCHKRCQSFIPSKRSCREIKIFVDFLLQIKYLQIRANVFIFPHKWFHIILYCHIHWQKSHKEHLIYIMSIVQITLQDTNVSFVSTKKSIR